MIRLASFRPNGFFVELEVKRVSFNKVYYRFFKRKGEKRVNKASKVASGWNRLWPIIMVAFLLVGMFTLLAPADSYAAGSDLTISGPGLNNPEGMTITQNQLRGLEPVLDDYYLTQQDIVYSTINTWPTKSWYRGKGVLLEELLEVAGRGLNGEATLIRFTSRDGFKATFTVQELLNEPRFIFPNFMDTGLPGHLIGDASGAQPVGAIIAYVSCSGQTLSEVMADSNLKDGDAYHLLYGQRAVTQQTNARFAKYVNKIEVLTDPVPQWGNPTASVEPGEVPVGTLVELHSPFDDEDKVHYTLDGSDPTIQSPMYNWIASRWWSSRADDLYEINRPIEITQDTTIKAIVIGPGRLDSDIVEFTYTVEESPTVAVTGVSITEGAQTLEVGQTFQLTAVVEPEDATNKNVTWSSSDDTVATVSETGLVTAVAEGTATITVTTEDGNKTDTVDITVIEASDFVVENGVLVGYTGAGGDVIIPGDLGINRIDDGAFQYNYSLTSIVIPEGVTTIDGIAFEGCENLTTVVLPQSLTSLGAYAFAECSNLSEINIPEGITEIRQETFYRCYALESLSLPNSITSIGKGAFWLCTSLSQINIPESVTTIGEQAFQSCGELTEIVIPSSVTSIGNRAFYKCAKLTSATILGKDTVLGAELFGQPSGTTVVTIYGYTGSTAETYASDNGIPFVALDPTVAVTGVSITQGDQTLEVGDTVQLTAVVEPEDATNKNVTWSSSDDTVATVSETGLVTAVAEGTATITVTTEDGNKTDSITVTVVEGSGGPTIDVLYDGTVVLTPGETFTLTVGSNEYTINDNTPLGALQAAAEAGSFTYVLSDKRWSYDGVLLLDDVGQYVRQSPGYWYAYVNDVYKDGYQNTPDGLNVIELLDGDKVEFYYAAGISDPTDLNAVQAAAIAAVKTVVALSTIDVLYDGTVNLDPEEVFTVTAYNSGTEYTVNENTPLGALHKAAIVGGFTYDVTDKNHDTSGALLLDNVAEYNYVKNGSAWYAYVNGTLKDGYNNPAGALNLIQLANGDKVEFYYADVEDESDFNAVKAAATAAVKTTVTNGVVPTDWTLQLSGARNETVTKAYFEQGLMCASSHQVSWTDDKGTTDTSDDEVWGGIPLWLLVAMVDDDPDVGDNHFNFNDELAAAGYEVKVIAGDGWSTVLDSADIARSDAYIVANTLNGEPLPLKTASGKDCWPLQLKGSAISGGQQVGNIVRIELSGLPEPPAGWTLEIIGEIGDTITQEEFEEGLACTGSGHYQEWTDNEGKVWSGIPLWVLLGAVDDIENGNHWIFNENLANSYTVKVVAGDGFSKTFNGADVANNNDYIVANKCDGQPLTGSSAPLRLVGAGVTKEDGSLGGLAVGNIVRIEIPELQTPEAEPGSWNLTLIGKISDVISQAEFEAGVACPNSGHLVEWTDADGNVWSGIPLWFLAGWVDDRKPHSYDFAQAVTGYKVVVKASDGYSVDFESADINKSSNYIIANKCNGVALTDSWPLRLVGDGVANAGALTGKSVGKVVEIKLTSFASGGGTIPELRIVKYGEDGTTIIAEETINYLEMIQRFDVIGNGETVYKFQGVTFDPEDIWDENETGKGGYKIANAVKGTRISDLCSLVSGMGTGTEVVLVASDGYETRLPYSAIYPDPSVYTRQGDAILAWYADGKYVPDYRDGMRLYFTPEDTVYSQMDMRLTMPEPYWHYYGADGIMYPSCAGLSAKYITELRVYSVPQGDWTLELDGTEIGGIACDISKTYFESALACQFGANHKASYTDSKGRNWEGMPLWFLVGFVDDSDQHSDNAFNNDLANAGYQVVITAGDGASVTIDSADIIRNNNYIIANMLDGFPIPEYDDNWPLRLVGPKASGSSSIGNIVKIELVSSATGKPVYIVAPEPDSAYDIGGTQDGIKTMTVKAGVSGFKYFTVNIDPVVAHSGEETVVFTHLRNGSQLQINSTRADFDQVFTAQAGFNVQAGDVIKVYIVDELTNAEDRNPVILQ